MAEQLDTGQAVPKDKTQRVAALAAMLGEGMVPSEIRPLTSAWGVTDRTIRRDFAEAEEIIGKEAKQHRNTYLGRNIMRLDYIIRTSIEGVDRVVRHRNKEDEVVNEPQFDTAVRAIAEMNKLLGLNEPEKFEFDIPEPWAAMFEKYGIKRPGNGKETPGEAPH